MNYCRMTGSARVSLGWLLQLTGWLVSTAVSLVIIYGLYKAELTSTASELYTSLARSAWAAALAWVR